jgi:hypothetical protein
MKIKVLLLVFSHLSDTQELARLEGNPIHQINRINFAKHLLLKYPDTSVMVDPDKEYSQFVTKYPKMKFL